MPPSGAGLAATGYVVAQRQASIASKGTGRLIYFGVNVGDRVKEGQLIARIEHDDMDSPSAGLGPVGCGAGATGCRKKPELGRGDAEFRAGEDAPGEVVCHQTEYDMASARSGRRRCRKSVEAAVTAAEAERQNATVQFLDNSRASTRRSTGRREEIGRDRRGRVTVHRHRPFRRVLQEQLVDLVRDGRCGGVGTGRFTARAGQPAEIRHRFGAGAPISGRSAAGDADRRRAKGTGAHASDFDLDDRVRPELSAKVTFGPVPGAPAEPGEDWGVPSTAVVTREGRSVVLVVRAGIVAEAVVQVGTPAAGMVPVHGPLSQTDEVIVAPTETVHSGSTVSVIRRVS
ncbi:MAG: efflux RND transporter periplasmic adaptor subunit [Nitrospiraceae bacterium]